MKNVLLFLLVILFSGTASAQDTFYVKKKNPAVVMRNAPPAAWDTTNRDSIVSYTMEYQKPGSNIFVVTHNTGPLRAPWEVARAGRRILFTDIIAIDSNGRKYRQPDRYYVAGTWVPVKAPK